MTVFFYSYFDFDNNSVVLFYKKKLIFKNQKSKIKNQKSKIKKNGCHTYFILMGDFFLHVICVICIKWKPIMVSIKRR